MGQNQRPKYSRTSLRFGLGLMSLLFVWTFAGCHGGEDSWAHYQGGGNFSSGPPSWSPDGSKIVFSTPCSGHGDIVRVSAMVSARSRWPWK